MSNVIALIPARAGSKGIPGKNFRELSCYPLWQHAAFCALAAKCDLVVVSSDVNVRGLPDAHQAIKDLWMTSVKWLPRPAAIAQADTPMYDVVKHAVETLQLAEDDILLIVQPTQPFRKPEHITHAVQMLRETQAHCVVSAVPLPLTHHPEMVCQAGDGTLKPWGWWIDEWGGDWSDVPKRRQDLGPVYKRDGTVYALYVKTLKSGTLYGSDVRPLILDPSESCEMDSEADWEAVTARWSALHG